MPRVFMGMVLAYLIGSFVNSYMLSRWKIIVRGKYFWVRSLVSSGLGQFLFTFIAMFFDLYGMMPIHTLLSLAVVAYLVKLIFTPIVALSASMTAAYLKKVEKIDVYDTGINYNPFKLKVTR